MSMKTLREISYEYARERGGGLPLTAEELCNCVVLWVQQYVEETPAKIELKAQDIEGLLEGSETVVVDLNEVGNAIEIHLDGEVVNKIERAILQPISNPSEPSIPVVQTNGSVAYVPLAFVKDVKLYRHEISFLHNNNRVTLIVVSTENVVITSSNIALLNYISIVSKYFAQGQATDYQGNLAHIDATANQNYLFVSYIEGENIYEASILKSSLIEDKVTVM